MKWQEPTCPRCGSRDIAWDKLDNPHDLQSGRHIHEWRCRRCGNSEGGWDDAPAFRAMYDRWHRINANNPDAERKASKDELGMARNTLIPILRGHENPVVVAKLMDQLAQHGTEEARDVIAEGLKNPNAASRGRAIELLANTDPKYRAAIECLHRDDPSHEVRMKAAVALGLPEPSADAAQRGGGDDT